MTYQEWIDKAQILAASIGGEVMVSPYLDAGIALEVLAANVMHYIAAKCASDPRTRSLLKQTQTISLTNGEGTLPANVLTEYISDAEIYDATDTFLGSLTSWISNWNDYVRCNELRLGRFSIKAGRTFHYCPPGTIYDPASGVTQDIIVTTPCVPSLPAAAGTAISISDELTDDLVAALADALRGGEVWNWIVRRLEA